MSLYQSPPDTITVSGREYPVETDFRVWVEFQSILTGSGPEGERAERLAGFMARMGLTPSKEALDAMLVFYTAESKERAAASQKSRPMAFDFQQDSEYIYAAFMGAYGIDLTTAALHWWRFKALFKALPEDCELCRIMRYRTVDLKDVPKDQRRFYQEQKNRYSLGKKNVHQTERDMREYVKRRFREAQNQMSTLRSSGQQGFTGSESDGN